MGLFLLTVSLEMFDLMSVPTKYKKQTRLHLLDKKQIET